MTKSRTVIFLRDETPAPHGLISSFRPGSTRKRNDEKRLGEAVSFRFVPERGLTITLLNGEFTRYHMRGKLPYPARGTARPSWHP